MLHPHGDVRDGQRQVQEYVKAFVESPHWQRGAFFITYDEWGGFFDHVSPPRLRDDLGNGKDDDNDFTARDRHATNIGWSLRPDGPDPEFDVDVGADPDTSGGCGAEAAVAQSARPAPPPHDLARGIENGYFERVGYPIGG